jgi:hypothetical protein
MQEIERFVQKMIGERNEKIGIFEIKQHAQIEYNTSN